MTGADTGAQGQLVKSAERTIRILETLAASPRRLTLGELQERTGYPRSSLHALLRTLRELHWLETDEAGSCYGIGTHALSSGTAYLDRDPALPHAVRVLEELREETGYTTHYARLDEANIIYLATRESSRFPRLVSRVGRRLPAHATALGLALLAELTDAEVTRLLPDPLTARTERTITDHDELFAVLDTTRANAYAVEFEHGLPGNACVGGVVGYRIPATDAISVSMPVDRATPDEVTRISAAVCRQSTLLAQHLRREGIR